MFSILALLFTIFSAGVILAQRPDAFQVSRDHPAIAYSTRPVDDAVSRLNPKIEKGEVRIVRDGSSGYLQSVLRALDVPVESQVVVFSQTSSQAVRINPHNPRAVFFADSVAVGWVRGGAVLEVAAQDAEQGVIFYSLDQQDDTPRFKRNDECLACHLSWDTLAVPGLMIFSTLPLPDDKNAYAVGFASNHTIPLEQRWGGWYVTGRPGSVQHQGNVFTADASSAASAPRSHELKNLEGQFDLDGYPTHFSDVVALMVLEHQAHMTNLLTRVGWESRLASFEERSETPPVPKRPSGRGDAATRVRDAVRDLVDYLLFVDEAPLSGRIEGSSAFTETFSARGPRDHQGRSLRQLDLEQRLMRYPCSYMIYTPAFDALPASLKETVYQRMWQVLSGQEKERRYARLTLANRQAIVEILRDTKKGLPEYFQPVNR
ncbi:MAG: hypothetical protein C5B57_08155 [Blastocatellia bacterium]|nr:MAG: hypothetical protein C5B57_08155 [Blastocatellia bacterium]